MGSYWKQPPISVGATSGRDVFASWPPARRELAPTGERGLILILILFSNYFAIIYFANYDTACILLADQSFTGDFSRPFSMRIHSFLTAAFTAECSVFRVQERKASVLP